MDFYEQLVHHYLTQERKLLVQPNLEVTHDKEGKRWCQQIDFLAVDLIEKRIYLIEVTRSKKFPEHLLNKLFLDDGKAIIEAFVREDRGLNALPTYPIVWWFVIGEEHVKKMKDDPRATRLGDHFLCTSLADMMP
jgi:hypothetical protein